jgi:hypothetical protein
MPAGMPLIGKTKKLKQAGRAAKSRVDLEMNVMATYYVFGNERNAGDRQNICD